MISLTVESCDDGRHHQRGDGRPRKFDNSRPSEDRRDGLQRRPLRIHVHVRVDVHGYLGVGVPREGLHYLGVNAAHGEDREVRMPELVKAIAL